MTTVSTTFSLRVVESGPYDGIIDTPAKLAGLPAGHWGQVPNTHILGSVERLPEDYPDFDGTSSASFDSYQGPAPGGDGGPHNVGGLVGAWSGGTLDTQRSRLLLFGGGHSSYGGNEVYAFDVPTLSWIRLTDPFSIPSGTVPQGNPNADGSPTSRHTYGGLGYDSARDSLWALGGAPWGGNSGASSDLWELPLSTLTPPSPSPAGWIRKINSKASQPGKTLTYIPSLAKFIATGPSSPQWTDLYDPATDQWTTLSANGSGVGSNSQTALDDEMQILRVKSGTAVSEIDIAAGTVQQSVTQSGPVPNSNALAFNSADKRFVSFAGAADVYSTARDGHNWTQHAPASGNLVTPPAITASGGVFGRFQYVPGFDVFIYLNSASENVFFYKL